MNLTMGDIWNSVNKPIWKDGEFQGIVKDTRLKYGNKTIQLQVLKYSVLSIVDVTEENLLSFEFE